MLLIGFQFYNGVMLHQLVGMPFFDISLDNTFWFFHLTGIPHILQSSVSVALTLELLMLALMLIGLIKWRRGLAIVLLVVFVVYSLSQQSYSHTLTKMSVIVPILLLPFCFREAMFDDVWKLPRYYLVFIMVSAALFKLLNGGLFNLNQMQAIVTNQHFDIIYFQDEHISLWFRDLVIKAKSLAHLAYVAIFLVELSFVVLLFTKRLDKLLCIMLILFCTIIYISMRINTLDMLLLCLPLLFNGENN